LSIIGEHKRAAEICGVTPGAVSQWVTKGRVPVAHCLTLESATEGRVTRYQLRPDIFGEPFEVRRSA
jgi:DNA-binding transcriptional regulator YdaS (Cro superfamily)